MIKRISREVLEISENPPEGIKMFLNEEDITDIQASIEGPGKQDSKNGGSMQTFDFLFLQTAGTPYEGGLFKMKLVLTKDFPSAPPQGKTFLVNLHTIACHFFPVGFFLTKIFHPNVAKNGAICVNTLKRDWKPDHGIKHILLVSSSLITSNC